MFKQRLFPLASAALLLFSCGGGASSKSIDVNIVKEGTKTSKILVCEKTKFKKGEKINFKIDLAKYPFATEPSSVNMFTGARDKVDLKNEGAEAVDIFEDGATITYNNTKLKQIEISDLTKMKEYVNYIQTKKEGFDNTFAYYSFPTNEVSEIPVFIFGLYNIKNKDKIVINGTIKDDFTDTYAFYMNVQKGKNLI